MNTVIVPLDFSETSLNAARYACKLFEGHNEASIILYHMNESPGAADAMLSRLEVLKKELASEAAVNTSCFVEDGSDLIEELDKLARHRQANLIIMGITGLSAVEQVFIGSNTLKMAEQKSVPVLIVPSNAQYREVKNVMLASDFKNVVSTTPSVPIKSVLDTFHPQLHIVNVDSDHYIEISENYEAEKKKLKEMFESYNPEFYFLRLYNVDEALKMFAEDKQIDIIINIHREHSLLHRLFVPSHTKHLVYESSVPVLSVHE